MGFCSAIQIRDIKIIPEKEDEETEKKIMDAVIDGNVGELEHLHSQGRMIFRYRNKEGRGLLHLAAQYDKPHVVDFLLTCGIDVNARDKNGDTALHIAVLKEAVECIEYLIFRGADSSIRNNSGQAPIHVAAVENKLKSMQIFLLHKDQVDLLLGGENGKTALHFAASYNYTEIAEALIKSKLRLLLTKVCDHGIPPMVEAARHGSYKTMELMLKLGSSELGYTPADLLNVRDSEGNTPLHSAVHSGDSEKNSGKLGCASPATNAQMKTVKLCLAYGAKISLVENTNSTPLHIACAQGVFEIVRLMLTMQPEEKDTVLNMRDAQGMTPLHLVSTFNHQELVKYLVEQGADINCRDNEGRTSLLLAASRGGWSTAQLLIHLGADIRIRDEEHRNLLHLIVLHGGSLEEFSSEFSKIDKEELQQLLNERDIHGCTPLHFASRGGRIRSTESLIRLGANVGTKNNDNESALHFATRYGRYNTVVELLSGDKGSYMINETDGEGLTPLHIAAQNGHTRIVQLLLNKGSLLERDHKGRTPLHLATENGYVKTMSALLSVHAHMIDQCDKEGSSPLHLAASKDRANAITLLLNMQCQILRDNQNRTPLDIALHHKHTDAAMAMATHEERNVEVLEMKSQRCEEIIQALISTMPQVFMAVLDRCITKSKDKSDSEEYCIKYDFRFLQYTRELYQQMKNDNKGKYKFLPLPAMNKMVQFKRLDLLCHPLCQKYITMKWKGYGMYFHMANLLIYVIFMLFLTSYSTAMTYEIKKPVTNTTARGIIVNNGKSFDGMYFACSAGLYFNGLIIAIFVIMNVFKEVLQAAQQRLRYLIDPINILEWLLYITAGIMVTPIFTNELSSMHIQCTAIASFLAWFNFLLYLQRFDRVGIYVVMFLEILNTLFKALMIFSILFIAFGLAFYILLSHDHLIFSSVPIAFIRVFSMMLGEFDILGTFVLPLFRSSASQKSYFPHFTLGFLVIFMVLMPILLVNLLIGLAVGDIEGVRRNAQLKRMAMQVELHTELERKLPEFILEKVDKSELIEYPNELFKKSKYKWILPIVQKLFGSSYSEVTDESGLDGESEDNFVCEELYKQKMKLREMGTTIEQLHVLVRLIVRKMEIRTEADDCDENVSLGQGPRSKRGANKWQSPSLRTKLRSINVLKGNRG